MSTQDTQMVGRFIHSFRERDELPTTWTFPQVGERDGCQTLKPSRVMEIVTGDDDSRDDWFGQGHRDGYLSVLTVSGFSGDTKPLKYRSVTSEDVVEMHVIEYDHIDWELTEISMELSDEGFDVELDEMGFPQDGWIDEVGEGVVLERLVERMETVEPTWVQRVPEHMQQVG